VGEMSIGENYERKITPIGSNILRFSRGTVVERKDLPYLTRSCTAKWTSSINRLGLVVRYPHRLLSWRHQILSRRVVRDGLLHSSQSRVPQLLGLIAGEIQQ
jgi:hypothetical protein